MRRAPAFRVPIRWLLALIVLLACGGASATEAMPAQDGVPYPVLERGRGDKCVADPAFMRRNHPQLLKHQRDDTVLKGLRTPRFSLAGCVECHAGSKSGSVIASEQDFCASCHRYAAVKLDCFECHASRPAVSGGGALATRATP